MKKKIPAAPRVKKGNKAYESKLATIMTNNNKREMAEWINRLLAAENVRAAEHAENMHKVSCKYADNMRRAEVKRSGDMVGLTAIHEALAEVNEQNAKNTINRIEMRERRRVEGLVSEITKLNKTIDNNHCHINDLRTQNAELDERLETTGRIMDAINTLTDS